MIIPRLYAVVDAETLRTRGVELRGFAEELLSAGVTLVQWRCKNGSPQEVLAGAGVLREVLWGTDCRLIMNDRADLAVMAGFDGVHVGQGDLGVREARMALGAAGIIGVSTHTKEQVRVEDGADYVAVGPVFATGTKADAAEAVGLAGVRRARELTGKPLVAIGGITLQNARAVIEAGADSVAVISGLMADGMSVGEAAREFLAVLG